MNVNKDIQQLHKNIQRLHRLLHKIRSKQLQSANDKNEIKNFITFYFQQFRPTYITTLASESELTKTDSLMQELLRYTHRSTFVSKYTLILKEISKSLHELELTQISRASDVRPKSFDEEKYRNILDTLSKINPSAALSYEQGLRDLQSLDRKSWRGTVVEFRETLREVLDTMAPDEDVKSQPGFKLEQNATKPTMKQKAIFILKSRQASGTQIKTSTEAIDIIEELVGKFVRSVYDRCSSAVHVPNSRDEAISIRNYVTLVLSELLEIKT